MIKFQLNGESVLLDIDPRTSLSTILREQLGLQGTKVGCGEGICGACAVILDNKTVNACLTMVGAVHGCSLWTIEGIAEEASGQQIIEAFTRKNAVQCGFCTPGFVMATRGACMAQQPQEPSDIVAGNFCRCTGYVKILEAVEQIIENKQTMLPLPSSIKSDVNDLLNAQMFVQPSSLNEAFQLLSSSDSWLVLAGATNRPHGWQQRHILDVSRLEELKQITLTKDAIHIGSLATFADIASSDIIQRYAPGLAFASSQYAGPHLANVGTIGGNIISGEPNADGLIALASFEATAQLQSLGAKRSTKIQSLKLQPDELITSITIPRVKAKGNYMSIYDSVRARGSMSRAIVAIGMNGWHQDRQFQRLTISLGGVGETVLMASEIADYLLQDTLTDSRLQASASSLQSMVVPRSDVYASAEYKRRAISGLLIRMLYPFTIPD